MKKIYKKEEVIALLEEYYRKLENREVKVSVRESDAGPITTYFLWVSDSTPSDDIEIAGVKIPLEDQKNDTYLPVDQAKEQLAALFAEYGLELNEFSLAQKEIPRNGPDPDYEFLGYNLDIERKKNLERN